MALILSLCLLAAPARTPLVPVVPPVPAAAFEPFDPPRRWVRWPQGLSIAAGLALGTAAMFTYAAASVCFSFGACPTKPELVKDSIGLAIAAAFLFVSGVVMFKIADEHNAGLPEEDG